MNNNIFGLLITIAIFGGIFLLLLLGIILYKLYQKYKKNNVTMYSIKYPFITIIEDQN